jgi:hypothetical protein
MASTPTMQGCRKLVRERGAICYIKRVYFKKKAETKMKGHLVYLCTYNQIKNQTQAMKQPFI